MSVYSIGSFEFLNMHNPPEVPAQQKVLQIRSGVDHVAIYQTGKRSVVSETRTVTMASSIEQAWEAYELYQQLVDSGQGVEMVWAGIHLPYKVQALEVSRADGSPRAHLLGVGPGWISRARLDCIWRLQVVAEL